MQITSNAFGPKHKKVVVALYDTYLRAIKNSIGTKLFRNLYCHINGRKQDDARDGDLSCDIFVSSILLLFGLIDKIHATVDGCVSRFTKYGWYGARKPKLGAVLVWEAKKFPNGETHKHIGFYIGKNKAISNSSKKKSPAIHHWTFNGKRRIEKIFWNNIFKRHRGDVL